MVMLQEIFGNTARMRYFKVISAPQRHKTSLIFVPFQFPPPISAFIHGQKCLSPAPYTRGPRKSHLPINQVTGRQTSVLAVDFAVAHDLIPDPLSHSP